MMMREKRSRMDSGPSWQEAQPSHVPRHRGQGPRGLIAPKSPLSNRAYSQLLVGIVNARPQE